ncbi:unnamed protein product [Ambrosiozyma monospora]|uniref:Unnamed protein product n=1 Tax=Ambrosiozyma monospora TaxID=43982 RepID=A0ACB5SS37_AMBMO|nr:unnamed protein product [Ambrosiozyma monospora]
MKLNVMAAARLLHVPMSYIDTTPMGRILNRFTKDTDVLDNEISEKFRSFIFPFSSVIGIMILCIIYLPWFAISIPFLAIMYACIANFYQATSREVKRLESIQRSAVYAHFNETLGGMETIKAYNAVDRFLKSSDSLINTMNEACYVTICNQRWFSINLDLIAGCICLIVALLCCFRVFAIGPAATGLLLTYVLTISGLLAGMMNSLTQIDMNMNSVERIEYYAMELPQEAAYRIPENDPTPEWPTHGQISFNNVSLKYRPELPYVLKDLTINIAPNERIGICGRTGAGKSTLMTCLYRLSEPEGEITIDGVDISKLGLNKLRSKLSIIPQDPVLFVGTIRSNLDPFEQRTDDELWDALRRAHLVDASVLEKAKKQTKRDENMHKFHLDQVVEDDGSNFSLGERQLLALARALVRKSRILILDEATSSVDYETDSKIQQTIVDEFASCTILCIAHRLKTIVNYDRILVLEAGKVAEFDTPWRLFQNESGMFRGMCDQSGVDVTDFVNKN